jgi:hypothetical protein
MSLSLLFQDVGEHVGDLATLGGYPLGVVSGPGFEVASFDRQ